MATATACPECEAQIAVPEQIRISELVECPECRSDLEVLTASPLLLAMAPEPEEDWGE